MNETTIWLVGDKDAEANNSWLAMTNDDGEIPRLMQELGGVVYKKIIVKPQKSRRRHKKK